MKKSNTQLEVLKLTSLPLILLILSYLSFLVVKFNYSEEMAAQVPSRGMNNSSSRAPSSIDQTDLKKAKFQKITSENGFKKPHGAIEVQISNQNSQTLSGQSIELVGLVTASRDINQVDIFWHLPEGIERVEGAQRQSLSNLHAGDSQRVSITVISHLSTNQQIHLEASYQQGNLKIGNTAQFNTVEPKKLNISSRSEGSKIWQ